MDISQVIDHSSSMSGQPLYEVFLSFRGPDMCRGFADFLYTMLIDVGVSVFRDDEELERDEEIYLQLIKAIEQSKVSIPVISKEYASSKSCLVELEHMVECMDNKDRIIIPIFYYVDPSDVRDSRGPIRRALDEHKKRDTDDSFCNHWMSALRRIGELEGHHLHEKSEVSHGEVVKRIVHQVQQKLKKPDLIVTRQLVGVDSHVQCIMAKLKVDYRNGQAVKIGDSSVKVLGIYGIPGVGKTVLAKYVYNQLYHLVDACSFLGEIQAEINRHGIVSVQNKLISDLNEGNAKKFYRSEEAPSHIRKKFRTMKVLVLLDDVNNNEQFRALVGEFDWLGPRSRVILTSQTQDVLRNINGAESFFLEPMKQDEALKLFGSHAFGTDSPHEEFEKLSKDIVAATGGLPLALEVIGSSLFLVKSKKAWMETLAALEVAPHKRVQAALEKSYNNLDEEERQIFLDIACFFIGMDKRIPYYMWHDLQFSPSASIRALNARSLVQIGEDKELLMHEILKKFGREIVKNENRCEPSKRSRLCDHEEALHVLKRRKGTDKVKALGLEFGDGSKGNTILEFDQFDGLQNLRFLKLDQAEIHGNFGDRLSKLRWLDWQGCPKIFDTQSLNLNLQNLVILDFSGSQVYKDWRGWELLVVARKLKVLKLTGCVQLTTTPKFPASMELERLILEGCSNLAVIDPSFGNLTKLISLNMKQCSLLRVLPDLGPMRDLKELVIDGTAITRIDFQEGSMGKLKTLSACNCKSLSQISDSIMSLKSLTYLLLDNTGIGTLPESIGLLEKLSTLSLKNCRRLLDLPDGIGQLRSLQYLNLSDTVIQELPPSVEDLKAMKVLRMRGTFIQEFPEAILNLEKLEEIDFSLCRSLKETIPFNIWRLSSLAILKLSNTQISGLPTSISLLPHLRELHIFRCSNLQSLPKLPPSLINGFRSDGEPIMQIVSEVSQELKEHLIVTKHLVRVDPHVQGIMAKLKVDYHHGEAVNIGDNRVKVLGIYGIPGVGKTVLAKHVYNKIHHLFDACSFLGEIQAEIKHHGIVSVQNRLISDLGKGNAEKFDSSRKALFHIWTNFCNMKVLILLDDLYDHEQLSALIGEIDWLGPGSRIILTSQTQDVLRSINGAESFVLEPMKQDEALKLFCRHAFGTDSPPEEFMELSTNIVTATNGLPLALKVTGSSLFLVKSKRAWRETLTALEVAPHKRVQAALKKSYTNLDANEREIFLDIACFFNGMDKRIPYYMWDDCKYSPSRSIRALHARSLVQIGEDKELCMHEILKKFGREIVKNENKNHPCKRSRLCDPTEALHVLKRRKGTDKVEALGLEFSDEFTGNISFDCDHFNGLKNLRFLKLDQADIRGNFGDRLSSLRWLDWQGCPKIFDVESLNLNLQNLVILDLSWSQVDKDWRGWELLVEARKLKVLKLTGCVQLTATPKFAASVELERLILESCSILEVIDPSFRNLNRLVSLNMKGCIFLSELPDLNPMRSLKELVIDRTSISRIDFRDGSMRKLKVLSARNCKKLTIDNSIGNLKSLTYLVLDDTEISTLPESIGLLEKLNTLSLKNCRSLSNLPNGIGMPRSLQFLDLSDTLISELPPSVKELKAMKVLRMSYTLIQEFPEAILNMEKLEEIDFSGCLHLGGKIPDGIWRLSSLAILKLSRTLISGLPASISYLSCLQLLDISGCCYLHCLPSLPSSLTTALGDSGD